MQLNSVLFRHTYFRHTLLTRLRRIHGREKKRKYQKTRAIRKISVKHELIFSWHLTKHENKQTGLIGKKDVRACLNIQLIQNGVKFKIVKLPDSKN